jgi:hypothetical protein
VPLKPLCDYLGVNWDGQRQRLHRDPVLTEVAQGAVVITAPSPDGRGGGPQEMLSLPLDYLNGWLFGINANRVKAEIREQLVRYQKECYRVLAEAFLETAVTDDWMTTSPETRAALQQIQEMGLAIAQMAQEQLRIMGLRLKAHEPTSGEIARKAKSQCRHGFLFNGCQPDKLIRILGINALVQRAVIFVYVN